jgi:hypothetical protein
MREAIPELQSSLPLVTSVTTGSTRRCGLARKASISDCRRGKFVEIYSAPEESRIRDPHALWLEKERPRIVLARSRGRGTGTIRCIRVRARNQADQNPEPTNSVHKALCIRPCARNPRCSLYAPNRPAQKGGIRTLPTCATGSIQTLLRPAPNRPPKACKSPADCGFPVPARRKRFSLRLGTAALTRVPLNKQAELGRDPISLFFELPSIAALAEKHWARRDKKGLHYTTVTSPGAAGRVRLGMRDGSR